MSAISLFKEWLSDVPEVASLSKYTGHWFNYAGSATNKYLSFQVTGGKAPREADTNFAVIQVAIVGTKNGNINEIEPIAEAIQEYSKAEPPQCSIVTVNPLGAIRGPVKSEGGRQVLNMAFEIIY